MTPSVFLTGFTLFTQDLVPACQPVWQLQCQAPAAGEAGIKWVSEFPAAAAHLGLKEYGVIVRTFRHTGQAIANVVGRATRFRR
jgi:hypothetical protein